MKLRGKKQLGNASIEARHHFLSSSGSNGASVGRGCGENPARTEPWEYMPSLTKHMGEEDLLKRSKRPGKGQESDVAETKRKCQEREKTIKSFCEISLHISIECRHWVINGIFRKLVLIW